MAPDPDTLNESQVRRLRVTCQHIDRTLSEIEGILNESASRAAFPAYIADLSPPQRKTLEDYIARVRARLVRVLEGQGIAASQPGIPVSRAVRGRLYSIDIAAEELKPKYMRGYGEVSDTVATELDGIAGELQSLVVRLDQYLAGEPGRILRNACSGWKGQATTSASSPGSNGLWRIGASLNSGGRSLRSSTGQKTGVLRSRSSGVSVPGSRRSSTPCSVRISTGRRDSGHRCSHTHHPR